MNSRKQRQYEFFPSPISHSQCSQALCTAFVSSSAASGLARRMPQNSWRTLALKSKIEAPGGDDTRRRGPYSWQCPAPRKKAPSCTQHQQTGSDAQFADAEGQELLQRFVKDADLLIHDRPPPRMAGLGLTMTPCSTQRSLGHDLHLAFWSDRPQPGFTHA